MVDYYFVICFESEPPILNLFYYEWIFFINSDLERGIERDLVRDRDWQRQTDRLWVEVPEWS